MGMPNKTKVFPRGYSGGQQQNDPTHRNRGGDPRVTDLWRQYTSPNNQSSAWSFRRKAIMVAKQMLAGRPNWFIQQDTNELVREYNYQFLIDTLRFIGTGKRRISIHAWPDLLSNHPVAGLNDVSERHEIADVFEQLKLTTSIEAMLQLWCSHPHGFDDMVCTLNLLFGDLPLKVEQNAS